MFYRVFGLVFQSEFPLEGAPCESEDPDVVIRCGRPEPDEGAWASEGVCYRSRPNDCALQLEEIANFRILNGREILVELHRPEAQNDMLVFLQTSAFGALFYQRGCLALHASVVEKDGQATLFCGRSSAGKSGLAAWLSNRGFRILSDEIALLESSSGTARVWPGPPHLKLWTDLVAKLEYDFGQVEQVRPSVLHKHRVPIPPPPSVAVPVTTVVILDWWNKSDVHWEQVEAPANFQALLRNTYRGVYAQGLGPNRDYFQSAALLARQARVYMAIRPDGGADRLPEFADFVAEKLA